MNKTEKRVINAIVGNQNKVIYNTVVKHTETVCTVSLFCNIIAVFDKTKQVLTLSDANWCTQTTQSRLNAILEWFYPSIKVKRRKGSTLFVKDGKVISTQQLTLSLEPH